MQPSKSAMQNLTEKMKKNHKTIQQKHCNISYNNPTQNNAIKRNPTKTKTKPKKQHRTLKLYLWQWEYGWGASLLGWCSKGFWVLLSGFLDFGCESFFGGGFGKEEEYKKQQQSFFYLCKNTNLFYLQKHQCFLYLQTHNSGNARENKEALEYECGASYGILSSLV